MTRAQVQVVRSAINQNVLLPARHRVRVRTHTTTAPRISHTVRPEDVCRFGDAIPTAEIMHGAHPKGEGKRCR